MILLDTNAILWVLAKHPRAGPLAQRERLYISPASLLELAYLVEVGKVREAPGHTLAEVANYPRWQVDNIPSEELFRGAMGLSWTRDPFDRLIAAHARQRRWLLATGDGHLHEHLGPEAVLSL